MRLANVSLKLRTEARQLGVAADVMPNGKPGDHPINDILDHRLPVYSPTVDDLVRRVAQYFPRERLWDLFPWFSPPPLGQFEAQLRAKLEELEAEAASRGWEPKE